MTDPLDDTKVDLQGSFSRDFFADDDPPLTVEVAAATHPGLVRPRNEDHYAVFKRTRSCQMLLSNLPDDDVAFVDDHVHVLLVADGVGGAQFGDLASQLAVETILQAARLATSWVMKFKDLDAQEVQRRVAAYVDRIQDTFRQYANADPDKHQMGTTLTAAYLVPPHALVAHVGDSRAYLFRGGTLTQITSDHTLAQAFQDAGAEKEEVKKLGHMLTNSLGPRREKVDAELTHLELQPGDRLLLCTDGLSDLVEAQEIESILSEFEMQLACDKLVESALEQGGRDNITVIVCDLGQAKDG